MLTWNSLDIALYVQAGALLWDKGFYIVSDCVLKEKIICDKKSV